MKKTAIILALCMAALTGCGRVDTADVDGDIKPFEIEKATVDTTSESETDLDAPAVTTVSTDTEFDPSVTTVRTGAVNLVKRTGIVSASQRITVTPSRGTVVVPSRNTTPRPSNGTAPVVTTAAAPATTVPAATTTAPVENDRLVVTKDDLMCRVNNNGIEILRSGEVVQTIEIGTDAMLKEYENGNTDDKSKVYICDFDFDGHDDLFIPQEISEFNTLGVFRHFNSETGQFEEWSEMSSIPGYAQTNSDEQSIIYTTTKNDMEFETTAYKWNDEGSLVPTQAKHQYRLDDSEAETWNVYIDFLEYPDGIKTLIRREMLIFNDVYEVVGTKEIEIEWEAR